MELVKLKSFDPETMHNQVLWNGQERENVAILGTVEALSFKAGDWLVGAWYGDTPVIVGRWLG